MTSLSPSEQASKSDVILSALMALTPQDSLITLPFLCYALIPKCERQVDYDIKPCVEACQTFRVSHKLLIYSHIIIILILCYPTG